MDDGDLIRITPRLAIPRAELVLRATRSGGPGGQHVNTSSTRIELVWNVAESPSLTPVERERIVAKLGHRLDSDGQLRIVAQEERSQLRNREAALARFAALVAGALVVPKVRRATRPTKASKVKRLDAKRHRGAVKRDRRKPGGDE